jgi:hypothetical protein
MKNSEVQNSTEPATFGKPVLNAAFLVANGFKLIEESPFDNYTLPYYVRESVMLFFNTPVTEWNENSFLIGYGEMKMGKYYAVTFKWIKSPSELITIFNAISGKDFEAVPQGCI